MVNFHRAWNVIFRGKCNIWDTFVQLTCRIGTTARGAMLPLSFMAFCVPGAVSLYTPYFPFPYCSRPIPFHIPHSALHTPHSTDLTLHPTDLTLNSTLYTPQLPLSALYTPDFPLPTSHSTLHSTLYTLRSTFHTPHPHSTLDAPHYTPQLRIPHV